VSENEFKGKFAEVTFNGIRFDASDVVIEYTDEQRRAKLVGRVLEEVAQGDFDDDAELADTRLRAAEMLLDYGYCGVDGEDYD
jgi:hypothetical protein